MNIFEDRPRVLVVPSRIDHIAPVLDGALLMLSAIAMLRVVLHFI